MWGSRFSRVEIYFRSKVISTSGFGGHHFEFQLSADVGSSRQCIISESVVLENMGVAVGIASTSISFQTIFLLPGLVAAILSCGCQSMSGHVGSVISGSGVVVNVGVTGAISFL